MENEVRGLDFDCKKCGAKLYAYYHEACYGDEQTGEWYVECTSSECDYKAPGSYATFEHILETGIYEE